MRNRPCYNWSNIFYYSVSSYHSFIISFFSISYPAAGNFIAFMPFLANLCIKAEKQMYFVIHTFMVFVLKFPALCFYLVNSFLVIGVNKFSFVISRIQLSTF